MAIKLNFVEISASMGRAVLFNWTKLPLDAVMYEVGTDINWCVVFERTGLTRWGGIFTMTVLGPGGITTDLRADMVYRSSRGYISRFQPLTLTQPGEYILIVNGEELKIGTVYKPDPHPNCPSCQAVATSATCSNCGHVFGF